MASNNEEITYALARAFRHLADLLDEQTKETTDSELGPPKRLKRTLKCAGCSKTIREGDLGRFATIEKENMAFHNQDCFDEFLDDLSGSKRRRR